MEAPPVYLSWILSTSLDTWKDSKEWRRRSHSAECGGRKGCWNAWNQVDRTLDALDS